MYLVTPSVNRLTLAPGSARQVTLDFMGFTKLDSGIVDSSIWDETSDTRIVWITLLALSDADGYVRGSEGWLAAKSRVSLGKCVAALNVLCSTDIRSRTPDHDGRRIERTEYGWNILNYKRFRDAWHYSNKPSAVRMRKHRESSKASHVTDVTQSVTSRHLYASMYKYVEGGECERGATKQNGDAGKWLKDDLDAMFKRSGRAWTYAEEHALFMVTASPSAKEEWGQIKRYHAKLVPKDKPFFPQSAISLLESWSKLLDKAAVYEPAKDDKEIQRLKNLREMIR